MSAACKMSRMAVFAVGAAVLLAGCAKKDDAIAQAEKKDVAQGVAAPSLAETKTIAEEGFVYGLPLVMNYAVMNDSPSIRSPASSRRRSTSSRTSSGLRRTRIPR